MPWRTDVHISIGSRDGSSNGDASAIGRSDARYLNLSCFRSDGYDLNWSIEKPVTGFAGMISSTNKTQLSARARIVKYDSAINSLNSVSKLFARFGFRSERVILEFRLKVVYSSVSKRRREALGRHPTEHAEPLLPSTTLRLSVKWWLQCIRRDQIALQISL